MNYENAMTEITRRYQAKRNNVPNGSRLPKGCLQDIVNEVKDEFKVEEKISLSTIHNRIKRNAIVTKQNIASPLSNIEPYIAETIIQMAKIKKPLTTAACIDLANSMIEGTTHQQKE